MNKVSEHDLSPLPMGDSEPDLYPEPSTEALSWLRALRDGEPPAGHSGVSPVNGKRKSQLQLVYVLNPEFPISLSLAKCRPSKEGGYGKPVTYRPQPYDLVDTQSEERFLAPEDHFPLRLFLAMQAGKSYFFADQVDLVGEAGALLLRQALKTGRLFLKGRLDVPLSAGESQKLSLVWVKNAAGAQQLAFDIPVDHQIIQAWPLFYVDEKAGKLGELTSELPSRLLQQLLNAPPLNPADAMAVRNSLQQVSADHQMNLPLPEAPDVIVAGLPAARLVLGVGRFRNPASAHAIEEHAIAELFFDYPDGLSVPGAENPPRLVRHRINGIWEIFQRDSAAEAEVWAKLQAFGLESFRKRLPNHVRVDASKLVGDCLMPLRQQALAWTSLMQRDAAELESQGIRVEIGDDFPFAFAQADDWFVDVQDTAGLDWFALDLGVLIGGERVSLVNPVLNLLRSPPDFLETIRNLDDKATYPVPLDVRRILAVPVVRLKAWLLPLIEFLDQDRPRLSRHHAAILAGLEDLPAQWSGGEALRQLGQQLRSFSGIQHCPPASGFNAVLRPYQQHGLDWLQFLREYRLSGILADDMGLGKTVQALAHIHCEKAAGRADRPSLVVATTSLMSNWRSEAANFTPDLKVVLLHGKDRAALFGQIDSADIVLTTYSLLVRDRELHLAKAYHLLVMDEAQFIKNPKAQSHQVARQLNARHRLSLTGTPLENHLGELWAQYDFLMPGLLGSAKRFGQSFRVPIEKQGDGEARARLAARIRPFMLRRTKEEVLQDLPPRTEMVRWVELSSGQRDVYESLRVVFDKKLRQVLHRQGVGRSQIMILDALLKLRQVCCDPRLLKLPSANRLIVEQAESAKLVLLMDMLDELLDEGRKVLVFSQFTSMLALIENELSARGCRYAKLTGQTRDREAAIRSFQSGEVPLFLISLKAGGTGLNLTAADTVIHYDPWWNPAVEEQATARAHRIGQDKPVFVYKLLTQGTVEEKILSLQERKRDLSGQLVASGKPRAADEIGRHLITAEDLELLFQPLAG